VLVLVACVGTPSSSEPSITPVPTPATQSPATIIPPTATNLPVFTPSPSMTSEVRLNTANHAFFNGDYILAQLEFQAALSTTTDPTVHAAALWGLGQVEYTAGNNGKALEDFLDLVNNYPESPNAGRAFFLIGEIYMTLERYVEAAQAFASYLTMRPGILDSLAQERRGDAYSSAGLFPEAIAAYKTALTSSHAGDTSSLQIKIAQAYVNSGDTTTALTLYESISQATTNDAVKAQLDLLVGRVFLSLGQTDQGYSQFQDAVNKYPLAYDSYSALVALVNANIPVDDLSRGLVDYFAGQSGYAVDAFQRYIDANPGNDGTACYYMALAYYDLGQYEKAIQTWDIFISNFPENPHWEAAWNGNISLPGRAFTQWYWLGQYDLAAETLLTFIQQAPNNPNAPIYLMEGARILERNGKLEDATNAWERIADEYSSNELVPQALFWAGIARYREAKYDQAIVTFQRDLQFSTTAADQARAYFWIGKTQQILSDSASAQSSWQQAAALDPTDYYSLRSQDMLIKRSAFDPAPAYTFSMDIAAERSAAEAWVRVTFNLPADIDLSNPGDLLSDPRVVGGTELWKLGLEDMARQEFEDMRTAIEQDPTNSYRLANYLLDLGLYRPAITAIRQVLTLAGMNTQSQTLAAPVYFNHIRYGLYYQDLVIPTSQQAEFDPFFIFSVMRQESLFEGFVRSYVGARGLMQLTPDTGQFVSDNLGWPVNYTSDDLYRPMVSITLGVNYLQKQSRRFDNDIYAALAAYNAGPEAAPIWRELSGSDKDLFVEVIRYEETRNYIQSIYEIYSMYRMLYGTIP
jgi:soluble lytic murein transglycosylase